MLSKLSRFFSIATLSTLTCVVVSHPSTAQDTPTEDVNTDVEVEIQTDLPMDELTNQIYWGADGDFFEDSRPGGQLNTIFGWRRFPVGSYPENEITRDGLFIHTVVSDYFEQQNQGDPTIRTRDLANPFNTSLRSDDLTSVPEERPIIIQYQRNEPAMPQDEPVRGLW